jgi:hypothetical protein
MILASAAAAAWSFRKCPMSGLAQSRAEVTCRAMYRCSGWTAASTDEDGDGFGAIAGADTAPAQSERCSKEQVDA